MQGLPVTEALLLAALAFTAPQDFRARVEVGGANGMRFSGSPSSKWDCSVCHDPQTTLEFDVRATPNTLFTKGYEPNQLYELEVSVSEAAPLTSAFSMEIVARGSGQAAGTLANFPGQKQCPNLRDSVEIQAGGTAALSFACAPNLTRWKVSWTAPDRDLGSVTLYASGVVGDDDATNAGDRSAAKVLGIPSPSTVGQRSSGCGAPAAALVIPFLAVFLVRRRRGALLVLLVLLPTVADAKPRPKAKKAEPVAPVEPPQTEVSEAPAPSVVEATASPTPTPVEPTAETAAVEPPDVFGPSVHVDVATGFGYRSLSLYSNSFATPLRVPLGYPLVAVAIGFRPMRLLRIHALEGLEIEGQYRRGWVVGQAPPTASAIPSDGRVTVGYALELGPVTINPRFVFRVLVGGVEKNFLFDDAWYQSVGGELALAVEIGRLTIFARPLVTKVIDTGTLSEAGYGKAQGGLSLGGEGCVGFRFGNSGFQLGLVYRFTHTTAAWAGGGLRSLGPITSVDQVHQGELALRYSR